MTKHPMVFVVAAEDAASTKDRTFCYDAQGKPTKTRSRWKYFSNVELAVQWSDKLGIALDGARNYIAARNFSKSEGVL